MRAVWWFALTLSRCRVAGSIPVTGTVGRSQVRIQAMLRRIAYDRKAPSKHANVTMMVLVAGPSNRMSRVQFPSLAHVCNVVNEVS